MLPWRRCAGPTSAPGYDAASHVIAPIAIVQSVQPTAQSEIVVIARKAKEWRAVLIVDKHDMLRCRVVASTGDDALDAQGCRAMQHCFTTSAPQFEAARHTSLPARTRKRLLAEAGRVLNACFGQTSRSIALLATPDAPLEDGQ